MATNEIDDLEKMHFKNYIASGAINIESIQHVENLFPGSPDMVEKFLKKQSKSQIIDVKLTEFIHTAKNRNSDDKNGKEVLAPYVVAFSMGYAPKMDHVEFNRKYGTSISKTTYNNWASPVFNDIPSDKYSFKDTELRYYRTVFEEIISAK